MSAKILVVRGGAIGDFILTLPVLRALRAQFPSARLEVLGYSHIASLALEGGLAHGVRSIESAAVAAFFARGGDLNAQLAEYFSEFAIILSYLYDPDGIFQTNVGRCSKAQFIQGPHRPSETARLHATEVFLKPLERLAIFGADPVPRLTLAPSPAPPPVAAARTLMVHPGSGSERKNWPEERWAEFLRRLMSDSDWRVLLVSGEAEGDRPSRLVEGLETSRVELFHNRPLVELARALPRCNLFVGHDSGISHLAASVGLPGLVLWGESTEEVWRPPSHLITVLRHPEGLPGLAVDDLWEKLPA